MAGTFIVTPYYNLNQREKSQRDLAAVRNIAAANIVLRNAEQTAIWQQKQQMLYPNSTPIMPSDDVSKIITDENQRMIRDNEIQRSLALDNLEKICDVSSAQDILNKLEPDDIMYFNQNYNAILSSLGKKGRTTDKNAFIMFIKNRMTNNFDILNIPAVTERGQPDGGAEMRRQRAEDAANAVSLEDQEAEWDDEHAATLLALENRVALIENALDSSEHEIKVSAKSLTEIRRTVKTRPAGEYVPTAAEKNAAEEEHKKLLDRHKQIEYDLSEAKKNYARAEKETFEKSTLAPLTPPSAWKRNRKQQTTPAGAGGGHSTGSGLIMGCGNRKSSVNRCSLNNGKYYIDMHKLRANMLSVKYSSSDNNLSSLPVQRISNALKNAIEDVTLNAFNDSKFKSLSEGDRRLLKRVAKLTKMEVELSGDDDDEFQRKYEILLGEYNSGNNSPIIKAELKQYVVEAMNEGLIPRTQGLYIIYQLSM